MVHHFGVFELDDSAGELRRNGSLVRLPPQPFQVLRILVQNTGQVVDRERLRREIWGETSVDFDRSLNVCIAQIRTALSDDADSPRFVQTLPRRGYRFLAAVEGPRPRPRNPALRIVAVVTVSIATLAAGYRITRPGDRAIRVAVLPFEGVENAQTDGLFDELLTRLGGIQPARMRVIGRRSSMAMRGASKPLREIGRLLDVAYVIEATVRTDGPQLRVAARLAQTGNDSVLWSETFAQEGNAADFEEQFVARVSAAVLSKLFPDASAPQPREAACRDGWEAYRTGRMLANAGTIAGLEKSLAFFEQAACPPARAALADTLTRLARTGQRRAPLWDRARAVAADLPDAQLAAANVAFWKDWDWKAAERGFQAALRARPSDPAVHHDHAWLLIALGRRTEGLAALERALALDPLSPRISVDAGWLLLQAGRFREAAAQARRTLELDPSMNEARACLERAQAYAGDEPRDRVAAAWREEIRNGRVPDPYQRAWRLAWIGSTSEALAELETALHSRNPMMPMVAVDPAFAAIRGEPRFRAIVRTMGL